MTTDRPDYLPDFGKPPLNEVVLGVQFSPPKGYQQILAGEVWSLFKSDYPKVEEQQALPPAFETFGLPPTSLTSQLSLVTGALHDRFWFLREDGDELIQFQPDRLLHNWRKVGDQSNEYPRFESMSVKFCNELERLQSFFANLGTPSLTINQCEVTYINHISIEAGPLKLQEWLRSETLHNVEAEGFAMNMREVIRGSDGQPIGRLHYDIRTGVQVSGPQLIVINLTARGAPAASDIASSLRFMTTARELIVTKFTDITTDAAHALWERKQ